MNGVTLLVALVGANVGGGGGDVVVGNGGGGGVWGTGTGASEDEETRV